MPDHPFREEIFPNIQPEPPLVQLDAIPSHPITSYVGEEATSHLATTSLQVGKVLSKKIECYYCISKLFQIAFGTYRQNYSFVLKIYVGIFHSL